MNIDLLTAHRRGSRRLARLMSRAAITTKTIGVTLGVAIGVPIATSQPGHGLASATTRAPALEQPVPSPFGNVQYDNSPNCAGPGVEVAYVANRLIVQTGQNPASVARRIDSWLAAQPAAASQASSTTGLSSGMFARAAPSLTTSGTRAVDVIEFPVPEDGDGRIDPVYAFDLPGDSTRDVVGLARFLISKYGYAAAPDYVTQLQGGHDFFQPDGLPQATDELPVPRVPLTPTGPDLGTGAIVTVFDSGLAATTEPGLIANVSTVRTADVEVPDRIETGLADDLWVGHGLAISSEIAALVPGATIENARITRTGISTDFTSAKRMVTTLATSARTDWPNVLVAAFGTMACEIDPKLPGDELVPVSLRAASEAVNRLSPERPGQMAIVAAAGNHGTTRKTYPAAFDDVIAVGALDATLDGDASPLSSVSRTAPVADFSARGPWIDFYAPGQDIITLHVVDVTFERLDENGAVEETVLIEGSARVQGTSFAAPMVAAQLVELMSTHHVSVWDSMTLLQMSGAAPQPPCDGSSNQLALGPGVATALANLGSPSNTPATAPARKVC